MQDLSANAKSAFRLVHRLEPPAREPRPIVSFVKKLSHVLQKIKVGHLVNAERGAFMLDVVERDRKLVCDCNNFYLSTGCLQAHADSALRFWVGNCDCKRLRPKQLRVGTILCSQSFLELIQVLHFLGHSLVWTLLWVLEICKREKRHQWGSNEGK